MQTSVRKRVAAGSAAAVAGMILLAGPAASLAVDVSGTATSLTTDAANATRTIAAATTQRPAAATGASTQSAPVSATVQGNNPHGQGTALSVSLAGNEAVVVNRSRGEQRSDGTYHGHTTTLGLLGQDVIGNDTGPGQTAKGPIAPIQEQVLDQVCSGSGGNVCVDLLRADSATTTTGSTNHSRLLGVTLGGQSGVVAEAADSNGDIQSNGNCQQAHGDVTLLKLMLGGNPLLDIGESASDSNACPGGTTVHNSENPLVAVGGQPIPLPGCGANAPGNLIDLSPLLLIACNAGAATGVGGIVNDALAGTVLANGNSPAVGTISGAGTGAAATPPPAVPASQGAVLGERQSGHSGAPKSKSGSAGKGNKSGKTGKGGTPTPPASALANRPLNKAGGNLPYTGTDVVLALFIASCLLAGGLGLRRLDQVRTHRL
jgi:hypothetical protein